MKLIIITMSMFVLLSSHACGMEISKTTKSLEYLYNLYYDLCSLTNHSDSSTVYPTKIHVSNNGPTLVSGIGPKFDGTNRNALYFIDNVPYIRTLMNYNGDKSDLHALGVETGAYQGGIISVRFPLSLLPQITSLETVEHIWDESVAELDVIENISQKNEMNPKMMGNIVVTLSNVEYNFSFNLELMVMGYSGYFPYFKSQWQFQAVKDSSNEFTLDKLPPGKYNLIFRPDSNHCSYIGITGIGVPPHTKTDVVIDIAENRPALSNSDMFGKSYTGCIYEEYGDNRRLCINLISFKQYESNKCQIQIDEIIRGRNIYLQLSVSPPCSENVRGRGNSLLQGTHCIPIIDSLYFLYFPSCDTSIYKIEVLPNSILIEPQRIGSVVIQNSIMTRD